MSASRPTLAANRGEGRAPAPTPLCRVLDADEDQVLADILAQLSLVTDRLLLLRLVIYRRGDRELTGARLERLARSVWHASEDARAAQRSWRSGR